MRKPRQAVSPLMLELSQYIAGAVREPTPREAIDRTKIHLVDTMSAMICG